MPGVPAGPPPHARAALSFNHSQSSPFAARFEHEALTRGLVAVRTCEWAIEGGLDHLPGRPLAHFTSERNRYAEAIHEIDDGLALVRQHDDDVIARIAAPTPPECAAVRDRIGAHLVLRRRPADEVVVRSWWASPGDRRESRTHGLSCPEWSSIRDGYAPAARAELDLAAGWRSAPPGGGRLLLWHGPPGTGKTTAVRTLARAWRDWVDVQLITDPERLLHSTGYLQDVLAPETDHRPPGVPVPREWRLLVLEDAGEFLVPDAKASQGQALSRLLNVCDGLLGMAFRALVLVTTNEPIDRMHPALTRPGRCVSNVAFAPLASQEASAWCAARGVDAPSGSRTIAELHALLDGRPTGPRAAPVGFAA